MDQVLAISVLPVQAMVGVLYRAVERGHRQTSADLHTDLLALGVRVDPLLDADAVRAAEPPWPGGASAGDGRLSPTPQRGAGLALPPGP